MADFTVSRLQDPARLPEVLSLVHDAFAGLTPPSSVLSETIADLEARWRSGPVFVAEAPAGLIGSVFALRKDDALYLTRLATRPAWRRHGVARALLAACETEAIDGGCARLSLRVRINLPENRAFFERLGFAVTGQGQDAGRTPYHAMERRL